MGNLVGKSVDLNYKLIRVLELMMPITKVLLFRSL